MDEGIIFGFLHSLDLAVAPLVEQETQIILRRHLGEIPHEKNLDLFQERSINSLKAMRFKNEVRKIKCYDKEKYLFPRRESNPDLLGESQIS